MDRPAKVLVVDDDADFLETTRIMLEGGSYRVAVAPGEEEALTEIEAERPDLLIMDVMMSEWNSGFQLMWKLKTDDRYKDIPVLMVTAVDKEMHIDFARHVNTPNRTAEDEQYLPVDGYIVKPVATAELLKSVGWVLKQAERRAVSR